METLVLLKPLEHGQPSLPSLGFVAQTCLPTEPVVMETVASCLLKTGTYSQGRKGVWGSMDSVVGSLDDSGGVGPCRVALGM